MPVFERVFALIRVRNVAWRVYTLAHREPPTLMKKLLHTQEKQHQTLFPLHLLFVLLQDSNYDDLSFSFRFPSPSTPMWLGGIVCRPKESHQKTTVSVVHRPLGRV